MFEFLNIIFSQAQKASEKQECVNIADRRFGNTEHDNGFVSTREKKKHPEESNDSENSSDYGLDTTYGGKHDHTYYVSSPHRLKRKYDDLLDIAENLQKRLTTSQKKVCRLKRKVSNLTSVVNELQVEKLISSDCASILETTFSDIPRELMKRLVMQTQKKNPGAYPKELRSFAMTLKFYSAKAYKYVQESFDLGLPHPSVVSSWYNVMDGEPGFTKETLTALQTKA